MFIQTQPTPNPETLKFLPGQTVMEKGTASFVELEEARSQSPLATILLELDEVKGVFLGHDFISITKQPKADWDVVKPLVLTTIMEHFMAGLPVMIPSQAANQSADENDDPLVVQIKELIETRVRPAVAQDGGDIIFHGFEDGIVKLEMHGACSGCPSSTITLKNGIENMLKHYVPEVMGVEAVQ